MLNAYIEQWSKIEPRPVNNPDFINAFTEFLKSRDKDCFEFSGDNNYCGHTAIVYESYAPYCCNTVNTVELAYGKEFIKVFTANHNGFWVPEYISLSGAAAKPLLTILHEKFLQWGGFSN